MIFKPDSSVTLLLFAQNQAHRFLHRMGHSLVSGPQGNLWMYGGLSLSDGILGNVYRSEQLQCSAFK